MTILIVGGTSGIGYYVGNELAKRHHKVIITTHTLKEKEILKKKLNRKKLNIEVYKLDICDDKDLELLDQLQYDVIWLNQAVGVGGAILSIKEEKMREIWEVNVFRNVIALKKAYKNMSKRGISGKLIVTSSIIKNLDLKYLGMYSSTKAALSNICYVIDRELKEINSNITITVLELGAYHTGFNQVMIDNKENSMEIDNKFFEKRYSVTKKQRLLFSLIEKNSYDDLSSDIIDLIESNKDKLILKKPLFSNIITKIYDFIFH